MKNTLLMLVILMLAILSSCTKDTPNGPSNQTDYIREYVNDVIRLEAETYADSTGLRLILKLATIADADLTPIEYKDSTCLAITIYDGDKIIAIYPYSRADWIKAFGSDSHYKGSRVVSDTTFAKEGVLKNITQGKINVRFSLKKLYTDEIYPVSLNVPYNFITE